MIDFYNKRNWKSTHLKEFKCNICKPPIGTKIFNSNTGEEQVVTSNTPYVLAYPNGMMQLVDLDTIKNNCTKSGKPVTDAVIHNLTIKNLINWATFTFKSNTSKYLVVQLPVNKREYVNFQVGDFIANKQGINHGEGDYIVCPEIADGTPDLRYAAVINGLLFPIIYSMTSLRPSFRTKAYMKKCEELTATKPQPLFPEVKPDTLAEIMRNILMKQYKLPMDKLRDFEATSELDLDPPDESWHSVMSTKLHVWIELHRKGKRYLLRISTDYDDKEKRKQEDIREGTAQEIERLMYVAVQYLKKKGYRW